MLNVRPHQPVEMPMADPNQSSSSGEFDRIAQAGRAGEGVRSDCRVTIRRAASDMSEIDVKSSVAALFGEENGRLIGDALRAIDSPSLHVELRDHGALPFVILARLETALIRFGIEVPPEGLPFDRVHDLPPPSRRDRPRRSRLYLPGNEPKFMINAALHRPDALILDLEDSVPPAEKDAARILVRNALKALDFGGCERMVRINPGATGRSDLEAVLYGGVDVVLIPKAETADDVRTADERCRVLTARANLPRRAVWLMPIIESARGAMQALQVAQASERVCALAIGLEDYTADLGVPRTDDGRESFLARSLLVNAARAAGVQAIDTVYSDVGNEPGLRKSVAEAKALGFDGKGCIHPRQIRPIHEAFAPSREELARAREIVAAWEVAQKRGLNVVSLGSKMIDPPVVARAQRVVAAADAGRG
jgi:citrate lyase subunit beta/citryl-CoA lyase